MATAAVPRYLGDDFRDAAPGHRFYLYFRVWDKDTWNVVDKADALGEALSLSPYDREAMTALSERQRALAGHRVWCLPARSIAPFATGLGMEHPLENGFAFLNPYGLPYLPGSGIKGVLRQAARELEADDFGEGRQGWTKDAISALFGPDTGSDDDAARGALVFWDTFPVLPAGVTSLAMEIMTPHYTRYYEGSTSPHDSGQPNPILFAAIPAGVSFTFYVECNQALLHLRMPELAADDAWQPLLRAAFRHAFDWLGFGAKTAVGYGHMEVDHGALEEQQRQTEEERAKREEEEKMRAQLRGLPDDAAWVQEKRLRNDWPDNGSFLDDIEPFLDERDALGREAFAALVEEMGQRWKDILTDPDAVQGKKQRPRYKDRQRKLAKRLLRLQPKE